MGSGEDKLFRYDRSSTFESSTFLCKSNKHLKNTDNNLNDMSRHLVTSNLLRPAKEGLLLGQTPLQ